MEVDRDDAGNEIQNENPNGKIGNNNKSNQTKGFTVKSCKGCLYYSDALKSKSRKPVCVGITRTLQQVPRYIVGQTELEVAKKGYSLKDFKYACVGYSVYLDNKDSSTEQLGKRVELPYGCAGLEVLADRIPSISDHVPAHVHNKEESRALPQPRTYKPPPKPAPTPVPTRAPAPFQRDDYLSRFKRNAGVVASGVAKNVNRVGNYIKETLEDIIFPNRRK